MRIISIVAFTPICVFFWGVERVIFVGCFVMKGKVSSFGQFTLATPRLSNVKCEKSHPVKCTHKHIFV